VQKNVVFLLLPDRHHQRNGNELNRHRGAHRPTNDRLRARADNCRYKQRPSTVQVLAQLAMHLRHSEPLQPMPFAALTGAARREQTSAAREDQRGRALMRILSVVAVAALVVLLPAKAGGETYASDLYGFSATFPAEVTVGSPQGSETDAKGNYISKSVIIQSRVTGVWTAMVTVETYSVPRKIDAGTALATMPRMFAAQLDATITASKPGKVGPYKARFFSYRTNDGNASGKGIMIVVPTAKPRTFQVLTSQTGLASPENIADLEKFLASFQPN